MFRNYFLTTIRTLRQNPLYTALSVFGIALTFVFVSVLLLIAKTSKGDYIPPKYAERTWQIRSIGIGKSGMRSLKTDEANLWISKMTTPESITQVGRNSDSYIVNDQSTDLFVLGVSDNYFDVLRHKFLSGRPINKQEIADEAPVAVLDRSTANLCFGKNEDAIGKTIDLSGVQYRVVGVVENSSFVNLINGIFGNIFVPLNHKNFLTCTILFTGKDKNTVADMQAEFSRVLDETNTAEDAQYRIYEREKDSLEQQGSLGIGIVIICLILMLIPAINILSLNVSKSFDRSEEIAIRKTFGAPISTIFGQLFFENLMLTLAGAVIGMCVTPILINAIGKMMLNNNMFPMTLSLFFDWKTILIVAVPCVLLFSFLSGSIPAYITAKRDIVNVLKGESL